jgi:hypothetical protein
VADGQHIDRLKRKRQLRHKVGEVYLSLVRRAFLEPTFQRTKAAAMFSHLNRGIVASVAILTLGVAWTGMSAAAEQPGIFLSLSGDWTGDGMVATKAGSNEPIRCRAKYLVNANGDNLQQQLRCASDSYKFEINSSMSYVNGGISGTWADAVANVAGQLTGNVYPDRIKGSVNGSLFSAAVAVVSDGSRQSVSIEPTGTSIKSVSITMKKK